MPKIIHGFGNLNLFNKKASPWTDDNTDQIKKEDDSSKNEITEFIDELKNQILLYSYSNKPDSIILKNRQLWNETLTEINSILTSFEERAVR